MGYSMYREPKPEPVFSIGSTAAHEQMQESAPAIEGLSPVQSEQPWPSWYKPIGHRIPAHQLIRLVAESFGMTQGELLTKSRKADTVNARSIIAKILHDRGHSYPVISRQLGRSCHSSSINSVAKFDWYCRRDPRVRHVYNRYRDGVMPDAD